MKKTHKKAIVIGLALVIAINFDFIGGCVFLMNDVVVMQTIENQDILKDYQYIELQGITGYKGIEPFIGKDYFTNKRMEYTILIRGFTAWLLPKDSVPVNENWKVYGYVTMDGRVFYLFRLRGDQVFL